MSRTPRERVRNRELLLLVVRVPLGDGKVELRGAENTTVAGVIQPTLHVARNPLEAGHHLVHLFHDNRFVVDLKRQLQRDELAHLHRGDPDEERVVLNLVGDDVAVDLFLLLVRARHGVERRLAHVPDNEVEELVDVLLSHLAPGPTRLGVGVLTATLLALLVGEPIVEAHRLLVSVQVLRGAALLREVLETLTHRLRHGGHGRRGQRVAKSRQDLPVHRLIVVDAYAHGPVQRPQHDVAVSRNELGDHRRGDPRGLTIPDLRDPSDPPVRNFCQFLVPTLRLRDLDSLDARETALHGRHPQLANALHTVLRLGEQNPLVLLLDEDLVNDAFWRAFELFQGTLAVELGETVAVKVPNLGAQLFCAPDLCGHGESSFLMSWLWAKLPIKKREPKLPLVHYSLSILRWRMA